MIAINYRKMWHELDNEIRQKFRESNYEDKVLQEVLMLSAKIMTKELEWQNQCRKEAEENIPNEEYDNIF